MALQTPFWWNRHPVAYASTIWTGSAWSTLALIRHIREEACFALLFHNRPTHTTKIHTFLIHSKLLFDDRKSWEADESHTFTLKVCPTLATINSKQSIVRYLNENNLLMSFYMFGFNWRIMLSAFSVPVESYFSTFSIYFIFFI